VTAEQEIEDLSKFILQEVPGEPSQSGGAGECATRMLMEYQRLTQALWKLLDDISTADDAAKGNDVAFRKRAYALAERRSEYLTSDGYRLFRVTKDGPLSEPEPER
jgi:hypothetical protein